MRILLVGNYALDNQASMSRYTEMLAREMRLRGHLVEVIRPPTIVGGLATRSFFRKWLGYVDKYLLFPLKLRSYAQGFDLVHVCDHSNSMYLAHVRGIPSSITCHDLLAIGSAQGRYPQQKISSSGRVQQRWILRHLLDARSVVCVSTNTARELAELSPEGRRRLVVIPNAVDAELHSAASAETDQVRRRLGIADGERYLLHVGGNLWYKNRLGVLRIFRTLRERLGNESARLRLVMAGAPFTPEMDEFIRRNLPAGSVIGVESPTDDDLRALYSRATALLFPSLYEGFGWPIAEAQSCGCPVITSNRPPMTEVAGGAALLIDPADEAAAAVTIAENFGRLRQLREAGLANAKRFDPEVVFAAYEGFFAGILQMRRIDDVVVAPNEAEVESQTSRKS